MPNYNVNLNRQTSLCITHNVTITNVPAPSEFVAAWRAVQFAADTHKNFEGATIGDTKAVATPAAQE